jgi:gliding motility-associated-like protein
LSKFVLSPCGNRLLMPVRFAFVNRLSLLRTWLFLPFALIFSQHVFAQTMVPDFTTTSPTSGCAPLGVYFKDLTTGNPKFWNWDFGNGTLSNVQNPGVTFNQPGTYTVKLVVRNADGTTGITKTNYITVYPSPSAGFTSNITTGCIPVNIQFTDRSTTPLGNIVSWQWDFGDGAKSTDQNPTHDYTTTGFYTVTLTVTSNTGCKSTASYGRYIRIVSGVKAEFDNSKPASCQAPYNINFTNLSSGPGNMTFQWDLGNGNTSTQSAPSTTYAATGTYNVTLTATSEFGCSGTITKPVVLDGPTTDIKVIDSPCQNSKVWFVNNSSVKPQKTLWDFGNGIQSSNTDDSTIYPIPGSYTIKLYNSYTGCKDSAVKVLFIKPSPNIDFTVTNAAACKPPLNVTFQDASPATIVKWIWYFGDGGSGTGSPTTHQYNSTGNYNVSVVFTDNEGCEGKITKPAVVKIVAPTVKITSGEAGGCVPFTYTPTADVTSVDGIATYSWDFGDGTVITSTNPSPSHTYTTTGKYAVKLTITTNGGCTVTDIVADGVQVGTPPTASFTVSNANACASEIIKFTDQSTPSADVNGWAWDFGDGSSSKIQNPQHTYLDSGTFIVKLHAFNNRCPSPTFSLPVHIKAPIAKFRPILTCGSLTVLFKDTSLVDPDPLKPASYSWTFGNPVLATSTAQNPTYTFPAFNQDYPVTLTITQDGCTSTYSETVKLVKELANFTVNPTVCRSANFNITSTNDPKNIKNYEWSIDGGTFTAGGATYTANIATNGAHSISLAITDINNCTDTIVKANVVTVVSPAANFTAASPGGCEDATITFNDHSTLSSTSSPLTNWTFNFGDGKTQSFTSTPYTHTYADTGEFVPQLTVQDAMGCTDTYKLPDTIFITSPKPWFTSDITRVCPKSAIHFADSSFGKSLTYLWDFGNGSTSVDKDPVFSYGGDNASYSVKLVITDRGGCKDSVTRTNYVTTIKPIPAFDIEDTLTICPPIETKFTFQGQNYDSLEWDFGDGATSTLLNPTHFYNTYGDFTAKLYLYGYGGCKDSTSKNVHVFNPGTNTTLTYSPLDACNELMVDFSLVAIPNMKFALYFGDGTMDSSMASTYQHFYGSPAFYGPYLQYTDQQGCIAGVGGPPIKVIGADPFFGVDRKKFCDSGTVYFTNYTIGNDPVVTRTWDFGDGSATSSVTDPVHNYQQPGLYTVSQSVTTQQGCSKTISDSIRVYRTPDPFITGDSIACLNTTMNLQGNLTVPDTAISWKWDLGNNNSLTTQNVALNFKNSGNYVVKLQASNALGCSDTTSKALYVPPTPEVTIGDGPVIPVGTGVTLPVTYGPEVVSYNWSPDKNLSCIDCAAPYANPKTTTKYTVKVTDQYGCINQSDVTVTVVCNGLNYFVPNTFSPNGDGVNDVFAPRGVGLARVNSMRIFNRWGEMVFERMNFMANDRTPTGGWDGTYKGKPASPDVYVYIIEFVCENNAIVPVKGNVALVR